MDPSPTVPPMAQSFSPGQAMYPQAYPPVITQQPVPQQQVSGATGTTGLEL